jgi:hypothetical protein
VVGPRRADVFSQPVAYLVPATSGEPLALESRGPVVRVGGAFVFWRTTTPFRQVRRGATVMDTPAVEICGATTPRGVRSCG